jgi:hypothetical protein
MGNFCTNISLKGGSQADLVAALNANNRSAYISPTIDGVTVVYDELCENQDTDELGRLASDLSKVVHGRALAILIHDDDIFWYELHSDGRRVDAYNSEPNYFSTTEGPAGPQGGDARKLSDAFEASNVDQVETILRRGHAGVAPQGYVFETERHADLVAALRLPSFAIGTGFSAIQAGELPDGLNASDFVKTG